MPPHSRRALLRALGAAAVGGLAGCQELTGTTTTDEPMRTATATPSATDSLTPTSTPRPQQCNPVPRSDVHWPLPRRSPANDAYAEAGATFDGVPSVDWAVEPTVPEEVDADDYDATFDQPVVAGDQLYVVRRIPVPVMMDDPGGHAVQARDPATDDLVWSFDLPKTPTAPAVRGDRVLVASRNEPLYAVDRHAGSEQWRRQFPGNVKNIVPTRDRILVHVAGSGDRDPQVFGLAPDGTERWSRAFDTGVHSMAVGVDRVYAGLSSGTLVALDRAAGEEAWRGGPDGLFVDSIAVTDCAVFAVMGGSGDLHAFDLDGEVRWRAAGNYGAVATDGATVYGARKASDEEDGRRYLSAVDAASGEPRWERQLAVTSYQHGVPTDGPPALTGDALYQPLDDGLAAVDRDDGEVVWRTAAALVDLALGADALYGVDDGTLHAMR